MKLLTESFLRMVDSPSAVTSSLHPPEKEQAKLGVAPVMVRSFLREDEMLAYYLTFVPV
jgi:hypothetical protein